MGVSVAPARAVEKELIQAPGRPLSWVVAGIAERIAALALSVLLSPLLAVVALATALLSRKSPLIALPRTGEHGKCIWLIKLRTMWETGRSGHGHAGLIERIEGAHVPECKAESDPRVTSAFAAFCRRYSIDEIPQLWHVVRGELALVGPRPLTYAELETYYRSDAGEVLSVKPGITGLWQVRGRNSLTYDQRLALDLYLVRNWSPGLYLSILAATIPAVLFGRNAG